MGWSKFSDSLAAVPLDGGGESGEDLLSGFVFFGVESPLNYSAFFLFNFCDNLIFLFPLQSFIAISLFNKNFCLLHDSSSHGKYSNKISHFWNCVWRKGYREWPASAGLGSFTAAWERGVLKIKIMDNDFLFNFAFYIVSLSHFSEEIWVLSGLFCATPRKTGSFDLQILL
jgi:hypothetical protein